MNVPKGSAATHYALRPPGETALAIRAGHGFARLRGHTPPAVTIVRSLGPPLGYSGQYHPTIASVEPPKHSNTWVGLIESPLPLDAASAWVVEPHIGGSVAFNGTARDHSDGRPDVSVLEYEAYVEHVDPRLETLAAEARVRWPDVGRIVMLHRVGRVEIGESAVVVAVGAPHRDDAFLAARFCIDTLKATVPIWKREVWSEGESWGLEPQHVQEVTGLAEPAPATTE